VLSGGCSWFAVTDGSAFGDSIIRKAFRRTDPPQEIGVAASNSRTPRTKARRLVCNGGYNRFAVNDGLRFANPSYELIRLTALSVHDALRVFSIRTLVATRFNEANKELVNRIIRDRQSSFLTTDYIF